MDIKEQSGFSSLYLSRNLLPKPDIVSEHRPWAKRKSLTRHAINVRRITIKYLKFIFKIKLLVLI